MPARIKVNARPWEQGVLGSGRLEVESFACGDSVCISGGKMLCPAITALNQEPLGEFEYLRDDLRLAQAC